MNFNLRFLLKLVFVSTILFYGCDQTSETTTSDSHSDSEISKTEIKQNINKQGNSNNPDSNCNEIYKLVVEDISKSYGDHFQKLVSKDSCLDLNADGQSEVIVKAPGLDMHSSTPVYLIYTKMNNDLTEVFRATKYEILKQKTLGWLNIKLFPASENGEPPNPPLLFVWDGKEYKISSESQVVEAPPSTNAQTQTNPQSETNTNSAHESSSDVKSCDYWKHSSQEAQLEKLTLLAQHLKGDPKSMAVQMQSCVTDMIAKDKEEIWCTWTHYAAVCSTLLGFEMK